MFAEIYDRHAPALHRYIARRLGPDQADDLVAETFLIAFRKRDGYGGAHSNARPWLYGIATNLIHHHHRAEMRFWRAIARSGMDPAVESPAEQVAERVTAQTARRDLAAALTRLSRGQRDVLLLTAAGNLSPADITVALGVANGTVHGDPRRRPVERGADLRQHRHRPHPRHRPQGIAPPNAVGRHGIARTPTTRTCAIATPHTSATASDEETVAAVVTLSMPPSPRPQRRPWSTRKTPRSAATWSR